ncbi:hypothetical protein PQB35_gp27 [Ochrobactrum phage vB_OspP_OH]|uniref:Uncharacterized protein n=1 Tax=Ochrobactrum phage vB_OspP_OH TaxID=2712957 RepID=A0A6G6XXV5_9CAUD|nr:hypothetical protein PQB35_gp27 [Ochrobactrum phage vB_OspP_OH]QIG66083.1 hypothetical protein phiOH_p27 [Ochrobactrum phage vB_OspP_OH]
MSRTSDTSEYYRDLKDYHKQRRERNWRKADDTGWNVHTPYHWSRDLNGSKIDYWPTRNKFRWRGRTYVGDVVGFIKNREKENGTAD